MSTQTEMGRIVELVPTPILPGDTGQLTVRLDSAADLVGVEVDSGGTVEQIIAGPHRLKLEGEQTWPTLLEGGKRVPGGAWVIVLARNTSSEVRAFKGVIVVANEERPAPKAVTHGEGPGSGGRRASYPQPPRVKPTATVVSKVGPTPKPDVGVAITPGRNEVGILLSIGNAQRVLQLVEGQVPLHDSEKPAIVRALKQALGR